jgi:hypothetical protein
VANFLALSGDSLYSAEGFHGRDAGGFVQVDEAVHDWGFVFV